MAVFIIAQGVQPLTIDETAAGSIAFCEDGCAIKGFDLMFRLYNNNAVGSGVDKAVMLIRKNEMNSLVVPTIGQMNALGTVAWKNRIFHVAQAAPGNASGLPMGIGGMKIPKRFHKMVLGDKWELVVANNSAGVMDFCGIAVYKWYR